MQKVYESESFNWKESCYKMVQLLETITTNLAYSPYIIHSAEESTLEVANGFSYSKLSNKNNWQN